MKMVVMNYYVGADLEVREILAKVGVRAYSRIPDVEGRLSGGDPRENSHVWPGVNSTLFAVVDDDVADGLVREIESYNSSAHGEGIDAYVLDVVGTVTAA